MRRFFTLLILSLVLPLSSYSLDGQKTKALQDYVRSYVSDRAFELAQEMWAKAQEKSLLRLGDDGYALLYKRWPEGSKYSEILGSFSAYGEFVDYLKSRVRDNELPALLDLPSPGLVNTDDSSKSAEN